MTEQERAAALAERVAEERAAVWADVEKFDRLARRRPDGVRHGHWQLMTRAAYGAWDRMRDSRNPTVADKVAALVKREAAEDYEDARLYLGAVVERLQWAAEEYSK